MNGNNAIYLSGYYKAKIDAIKNIIGADMYDSAKEKAIAAILEVELEEEELCEEI